MRARKRTNGVNEATKITEMRIVFSANQRRPSVLAFVLWCLASSKAFLSVHHPSSLSIMASDAEAPSKVEIVDDNAPVAEAEAAAAPAEVAAPAEAASKAAAAAPKYSKAEKKARKAILKLGLKEIPGVFRVTLKRNPSVSFSFSFSSSSSSLQDAKRTLV